MITNKSIEFLMFLPFLIILMVGVVLAHFFFTIIPDNSLEQSLDFCENNLYSLSCSQVQDCHTKCSDLEIINWQRNCRDKYEPRLISCLTKETQK